MLTFRLSNSKSSNEVLVEKRCTTRYKFFIHMEMEVTGFAEERHKTLLGFLIHVKRFVISFVEDRHVIVYGLLSRKKTIK